MALEPENMLTPCPQTPNCVSSLADTKRHFIASIPFRGDSPQAQYDILGILYALKRVRVVRFEENYIHAEFVSPIFRFVDDVEFYVDDAKKILQVKSASRIGYSDLGANRRRVEMIRKRFEENVIG